MKESGIGSQKIIRGKRDGELEYLPDELTIEQPLEIRVGRKPIATTMRTPGHDEELAAGFLISEGIVRARDQIASISVTGDNTVVVEFTAGVKLKLKSTKRFGTISSSCGLCGKTNIDAIRQNFPAVRSTDIRIDIETLLSLPETLRNAQSDFARTGGIHAAGIFSVDGKLKIARADIGRHACLPQRQDAYANASAKQKQIPEPDRKFFPPQSNKNEIAANRIAPKNRSTSGIGPCWSPHSAATNSDRSGIYSTLHQW